MTQTENSLKIASNVNMKSLPKMTFGCQYYKPSQVLHKHGIKVILLK